MNDQYFVQTLDFKHLYDLQCWRCLSVFFGCKFKHSSDFFMTLELQHHKLVYIDEVYFISLRGEAAVYEHFRKACDY